MAATLKDLASELHAFFAEKIPGETAGAPGDILLVFDALGVPLDPLDFGVRADGTQSDVFANQRAAELADQLPAANTLSNGSYLARPNSRLSRWYEAAITTSAATATVDPELSAFEQRKANARAMFDLNKVIDVALPGVGVAVVGEHDHHYATSMSPHGWFMPNSQSWSKYSQTGGEQDSPPEAPPPIRIPDFELRIIKPDPPPEVVRFVTDASELAIRNLVNVDPPLHLPEEEVNRFKTVPRVGESMVLKPRVTENLRPTFDVGGLNRNLNLKALVNAGQSITLTPRAQNFRSPMITAPGLLDLRPQAPADIPPLVNSPDLNRLRTMITSDTLQKMIGATTPQKVKTEGFTVSFDYTIVAFERPWWDEVFLALPGWRLPGFTPGQLATGAVARTASQFITLITCGMVVIRNLEIKAAWEGSDLESAPSAASLGPFCIAGAEWNEQALRRPGLQAIAWLCQVPPVIPPN